LNSACGRAAPDGTTTLRPELLKANETCPRPRKDQEQSVTGGPSPEGLDVDHLSGETLDTRAAS
jgi:hypothetical protein